MIHRITFSIALALLLGTKAIAQEWEYCRPSTLDTFQCFYHDVYELDNNNIIVKGVVEYGSVFSTYVELSLFSPDGDLLACTEHFKPGFWGDNMHFLKNDDGELFVLTSYNPDHDYENPNYFMNFDTVPDYGILGLYKLDDSLRIVQSMEQQIPVDTFELRGDYWWEISRNMRSGYIWPISAFVDDDGCIVGNYVKAISLGHEEIAKDTIVFFRMDFEGNLITKVDFACVHYAGDVAPISSIGRKGNMVKANDTTYVMYDLSWSIYGGSGNVIYLDRDFNVTLVRRITNLHSSDDYFYQWPTIIRSPHNTTYLSTIASENRNTYAIRLYEYDDSDERWDYMLPVQYIKRSYDWDRTAPFQGIDLFKDGTICFAYTLNTWDWDIDSWMMIERLDGNMDTISTLYYDIYFGGTGISSRAYSIRVLSDGGLLLVSNSRNVYANDQWWTTVTKFPAEAFVGVEEAHANGLKTAIAYPNPGKDMLNIRTGLKNAHVEVYDTSGRLMHRQALTRGVIPIATEDWSAGLYVWKVFTNNNEVESGKWVKE